jgi:hypothetical protein
MKFKINDCFYYEFEIPGFYRIIEEKPDGYSFQHNGLFIIISIEIKNNKRWVHVSLSRKNKIPDYEEIIRIKRHFIGEDKKAIMIFPEKENHVNICKTCLHLYCCLDKWDIPEFSKYGSI